MSAPSTLRNLAKPVVPWQPCTSESMTERETFVEREHQVELARPHVPRDVGDAVRREGWRQHGRLEQKAAWHKLAVGASKT